MYEKSVKETVAVKNGIDLVYICLEICFIYYRSVTWTKSLQQTVFSMRPAVARRT